MKILKTILEKYKSETPKIWRKITYISISLKVACGAILAYNTVTALPDKVIHIAAITGGVCVFITAYSESRIKQKQDEKTNPKSNSLDNSSNTNSSSAS